MYNLSLTYTDVVLHSFPVPLYEDYFAPCHLIEGGVFVWEAELRHVVDAIPSFEARSYVDCALMCQRVTGATCQGVHFEYLANGVGNCRFLT